MLTLPGTYRLDAVFPVRYNKQICQQGSGDGVVCATDGTGNNAKDGLWIGGKDFGVCEVGRGQHRCHTGILHANFYGQCAFLCLVEMKQFSYQIACGIS